MSNDTASHGLQDQLSAFWSDRATTRPAGTMAVRDEQEHQAWLDSLRPLLPRQPVDALDIGTGRGFLALLLADLGHRVIGVDTAEGMLDEARRFAAGSSNPPRFQYGNAIEPPLEPGSIDIVSNRQVVWTLLDPAQAFKNWMTLLRPGGMLLSVHLRQNRFETGSAYPAAVQDRLPALRLEPGSEATVTRADREYADAVANLARESGYRDVKLTSLALVDRYEENIARTERRWLTLTGRKST
jgi:SAM-dependent methyltransferase